MRIVAGTYGGRRLQVPKGRDIRPTSDKVRGAIFNALEARGFLDGAHVLDAFCGTGALGLEALSRGAGFCTFWDKDKASLALAKENATALDVMGQCAFHLRDAAKQISENLSSNIGILFLDPPYRKGFIELSINALQDSQVLDSECVIVMEMERDHDPNLSVSHAVHFDKAYGDTRVLIVQIT